MTGAAIVTVVIAAALSWSLWRTLPAPPAIRRGTRAPELPAQALRIDRLVRAGVRHAGDVHQQLRPLVAEAVEPALARRGLALDSAGARELLGEDVWELVRPDRPRPEDPWAPGLKRRELERIVDRVEEL